MNINDVFGTGEATKEAIKQVGEIVKEPIGNLVNPVTNTFGERLSNIVDLIYTPVELAKIYKDHKIEQFKNKLKEKSNSIPADKRISPPVNIIGPAIEASKFYIDEEIIQDMFASLITGSMHSDISDAVHPSFVEVIKQLSVFDAELVTLLKDSSGFISANYFLELPKKPYMKFPLLSNVVLAHRDCKDIGKISASVTNLIRLGLLDNNLSSKAAASNNSHRVKLRDDVGTGFMKDDIICQFDSVLSKNFPGYSRSQIGIDKGFLSLTSYGSCFVVTCIKH